MSKIENKGLTVRQLYQACAAQVANGNGNRHILISQDDEGNGYHRLFFLFSDMTGDDLKYCQLPLGLTPADFDKEYIILG